MDDKTGDLERATEGPPTEPLPLERPHSEFDLTLVIILIGLLGIGLFMLFIVFTSTDEEHAVENGEQMTNTEEVTEEAAETVKKPPTQNETVFVADGFGGPNAGDDRKLFINVDQKVGAYFVIPGSRKTLYVMEGSEDGTFCVDACLDDFTPYIAEEGSMNEGSLTSVRRPDTGEYQYAWLEMPLYTYNKDIGEWNIFGMRQSGWHVAQPE